MTQDWTQASLICLGAAAIWTAYKELARRTKLKAKGEQTTVKWLQLIGLGLGAWAMLMLGLYILSMLGLTNLST